MLHYLKFFHYYLIVGIGCMCLMLADIYIIAGFVIFVGIYVLGDAFLGDDLSTPTLHKKWLLDGMLYSSLPISFIILCISAWLVSPHNPHFIDVMSQWFSYDFATAKANTSILELGVGIVFAGFMLSGIATVVGHELVHRIGSKRDVCLGRWLMSFSFDANFSIEHVYHHHAKVATIDDPVTAPRGRNVYVHIVRAIIGTNRSAWLIEKKRLARNNQGTINLQNRFIRGWLMTVTLLTACALIFGWQSALYIAAVGIMAKIILEIVNYMEHYGLVRHPRQPVKPKHSWNSNRKISCWAMFNLPRHSHHHAQGAVSFEKLKPMPEAPLMISGYISTIAITLIPPLWFALMKPKLAHWDNHFANNEELEIIRKTNEERQSSPFGALFW